MSRAHNLLIEGDDLRSENKLAEAMEKYDEAISLEPSNTHALGLKAITHSMLSQYEDAIAAYQKAFVTGQGEAWMSADLAKIYTFNVINREKALDLYEQAVKGGYNNTGDLDLNRGNCYIALDRLEEARESFMEGIEHEATLPGCYSNVGGFFDEEGNKEEALKYYDMGLSKSAEDFTCNLLKADLLSNQGQQEEALNIYKTILSIYPTSPIINLRLGNLYVAMGQKDEARQLYEDGTQSAAGMLNYCCQAQCLVQVRRVVEAKAVFKKLQDMLAETNRQEIYAPIFINQMKAALNQPIKSNLDDMRETLTSKLEEFLQRLEVELNTLELSDEDKKKLQGYFTAFFTTFSSSYITARVMSSENDEVSLETDTEVATVLSFLVSFAPYVSNARGSEVKSVLELLSVQELLTNANQLVNLAADPVALGEIIGNTGIRLVMDQRKQKQILKVSDEDVDRLVGKPHEQVLEFIDSFGQNIEVALYTELYKVTTERLGHGDANKLTEVWIQGQVVPPGVEDQFVQKLLKPLIDAERKPVPVAPPVEETTHAKECRICNMF